MILRFDASRSPSSTIFVKDTSTFVMNLVPMIDYAFQWGRFTIGCEKRSLNSYPRWPSAIHINHWFFCSLLYLTFGIIILPTSLNSCTLFSKAKCRKWYISSSENSESFACFGWRKLNLLFKRSFPLFSSYRKFVYLLICLLRTNSCGFLEWTLPHIAHIYMVHRNEICSLKTRH